MNLSVKVLRDTWACASTVRGLTVAATIALAARFIADHHGGPALLYALLLGTTLHFLSADPRLRSGIDLASGSLLRLGVALIGVRISFDHLQSLGIKTVALVVGAALLTIGFSTWLGRRLGWPSSESAVAGGAVAVCGASATMALAAALPQGRAREHVVLLIVVGVTVLSTLAMLVYPLIVRSLDLPADSAGIFIGGSIHDVAQVVGAGYLLGQESGDAATLTKMLRVAMLVPLVLAFSYLFKNDKPSATPLFKRIPPFLLGFIALMVLNSLGWVSANLHQWGSDVSRMCILIAIAALGMRTSLESIKTLGWTPLVLLSLNTLLLASLVLAGLIWLR